MGTDTAGSRTWLAAGGGAVVGAAAAVAVLVALGWSGESASGADTLTLPETAAGLRLQTIVEEEVRGEAIEGQVQALAETAELLSMSRGEAATDVQVYSDDEFEERVTIWVVADESPALWSSRDSDAMAELMVLETPMEWVERDGEVECLVEPIQLVRRDSGGEVETRVSRCQLVQDGVTLLLEGTRHDTVSRPAEILRDVATHLERG